MTKLDFKDFCIMTLKDVTPLFEVVEKYFIEELVNVVLKKQVDNMRDIKKDFEMLQEWYEVPELHILIFANIILNLYNYYFKNEE